jgi:hypothetical protein
MSGGNNLFLNVDYFCLIIFFDMLDVKILIATHKFVKLPKFIIYMPIQVGGALTSERFGYQLDSEGENISSKNPNFCELTALYWGWKNLKSDYIGLAHYRRHFSLKKKESKFDSILTGAEAIKLCDNYDVVLPKKRNYYISSLWEHYKDTHDISHLECTRLIIETNCPQYLSAFDKVMGRTWGHMFNMYIMKKELSDKYCEWLFPILFELESKIDFSNLSAFDARLFGRVSELLLDVWIEANNLKYKEIGMVQLGKENWNKKILSFFMAKFLGKKYSQSR